MVEMTARLRDAVSNIIEAASKKCDTEFVNRDELLTARERLSQAVRGLRDLCSPADRLEIVRKLYEDRTIYRRDLAFVIFGDERKVWNLQRLLAPAERPCDRCDSPVETDNSNFNLKSVFCNSCLASLEMERKKCARENAADYRDRHRKMIDRFDELKAKCGLNEEELGEFVSLAVGMGFGCWS